ncbi:ABC transporter permease subunit [Deinococcus sp. HMF7620]|uniref:ABC transporter permease subunit n=1 Tax=Deinococcus arboris TaxID=2682977 RepID=A0A7C9M8P5_9DEIO|nr:ABC transporter permease [Deinococcus arboris]MVN87079.1 ABC transporter permease subunit [Deinococcus arboris]
MLTYVLRRLLALPLILLAVTFLIVLVTQLIPPEQRAASYIRNLEQLARVQDIIRANHLDGNVFEQYGMWLQQVLAGNLGLSRTSGQPVLETLLARFPATVELALYTFFPLVALGVWLGSWAAVQRGRAADTAIRVFAVLGHSVPSFVLGVWLLVLFYGALGLLPGTGNLSNDGAVALLTGEVRRVTGLVTVDALLSGRPDVFWDAIQHLVLPVLTLLLVSSAALVKGTRASMIEALSSDYIRTARAKGVAEGVVVGRHARRNALLTVVTLMALSISGLLQGAVLAETLYGYPGVGGWAAQAAAQGDLPGMLGFALLTATIVVVANLLADLAYALIDPRVRYT